MPEDLLLLLEKAAPVAGSLENMDDLLRIFVREMRLAVNSAKGSAAAFRAVWERFVQTVVRGETESVQATRQEALDRLHTRLGLVKRAHARAITVRRLCGEDAPDPDELLPEIAGLEKLKAEVFDRWESVEDLEDLVAAQYCLTSAQLDALARQIPRPQRGTNRTGNPSEVQRS